VADLEENDEGDGTEAVGVLPVKLDELIEVAVRLSPELARTKAERLIAKGNAGASRKEQSWILGAEATYAINAVSRDVEVPQFAPVREDQAKASLRLGRKLPTGGQIGVEISMNRTGTESNIPQEYLDLINGVQMQATQQPEKDEFTTVQQATAKL